MSPQKQAGVLCAAASAMSGVQRTARVEALVPKNKPRERLGGRQVPRSTLYRHLHREGAARRKLGLSKEKTRCRRTRQQSNALWLGDFEHGPLVVDQGEAIKTRLSAWIDRHNRYVIEARCYVRKNLDILIDSLLRVWGDRGAPQARSSPSMSWPMRPCSTAWPPPAATRFASASGNSGEAADGRPLFEGHDGARRETHDDPASRGA